MLKLIKYLKPFTLTVLVIILLLFVQAVCDLTLPDYTSNIVNIGIQQGGIENAVPQALRQSELAKIKFFLSPADQAKVTASYTLLDQNSLSASDWAGYVKAYPRLAQEPVYQLNVQDKERLTELNSLLGKPILIVAEMAKNGMENVDLTKLPAAQVEAIKKMAAEKFAEMPDSMITQAAVAYIRTEYGILGMNTDKIQNNYILLAGLFMLLIALLSMASTVIVSFLGARVAAGLARKLRQNVFRKVVSFANAEFDQFSTASLITRSTNDIQQIQMLMVLLLRIVFYAPILGIGGVIKVLNSDYSMGWIIVVAVVAILSLVIVLFGVAIPKFKMVQKLVDKLNLVTREILSGILVIRAFNTQKYEEKKFAAANGDLTRTNLFVTRVMALMMPVMMLIMNGITLLIVWVGAHQVDQGAMQVGNMMAFIQYAMQIIMSFLMISMVSIMLPRATVAAERIGEILDAELTVKDVLKPQHFAAAQRGTVEFKEVSFRYPGAEEDVLSGISFLAQPGQTTAFIGSTGSGKTTLINLIPRFYDVTGGQILVDGTDVKTVSQHELREKIGYVPQKAILFSGTIASNLQYGVEAASAEDLTKAAGIAQALEFIRDKEDGFDARIAQGGANVSGGQKQRLAIGRALVKKPEIYIFDDSFSALDFKTEAALRKALREETANSTILLVAQRISTIMNADQIIVLDEGRMVGQGTHQELMNTCEVYQQIALSQLSKEELA
jgi:ATP-binding cassette subfamily B multidrug efflux pump